MFALGSPASAAARLLSFTALFPEHEAEDSNVEFIDGSSSSSSGGGRSSSTTGTHASQTRPSQEEVKQGEFKDSEAEATADAFLWRPEFLRLAAAGFEFHTPHSVKDAMTGTVFPFSKVWGKTTAELEGMLGACPHNTAPQKQNEMYHTQRKLLQ